MIEYIPAPDSFWLKDLRNVLENDGHDDHDKIAIIREMMPDNFGTENI